MGGKKLTKAEINFHKKFLQVLETKDSKFWMKNLGIQYNLLWGWKKGNFPGLPYALEICRISGISANWLFLDIGPQYLEELNGTHNTISDNEREYLQNLIWDLERQLKKEKTESQKQIDQINVTVQRIKAVKWFYDLFDMDTKQIQDIPIDNVLTSIISPMLDFLGKNANEVTGGIAQFTKSKKGKQMIRDIASWIDERK